MRSCREITALVSMALDKELNSRERFAVRLHLMMCSHCRNFQKQMQFLRKAALCYTDQLKIRLDDK